MPRRNGTKTALLTTHFQHTENMPRFYAAPASVLTCHYGRCPTYDFPRRGSGVIFASAYRTGFSPSPALCAALRGYSLRHCLYRLYCSTCILTHFSVCVKPRETKKRKFAARKKPARIFSPHGSYDFCDYILACISAIASSTASAIYFICSSSRP